MNFDQVKKVFRASKIVLSLFVLLVGAVVILMDNNFEGTEVSSSFENEPVKVLEFQNLEIPEEDKPRRIIIPKHSIDLQVKESNIVGGYWEVYDSVAGWGTGSSPPGHIGNQVIFAHAREGLFGNLDKVVLGEKVYVFNENNWFSYVVTDIKEVYPNNTEVIEQSDNERLTLYTCSGFRDEKRLIVIAERQNFNDEAHSSVE